MITPEEKFEKYIYRLREKFIQSIIWEKNRSEKIKELLNERFN